MTSKTELKRIAVQNPQYLVERIYWLERHNEALQFKLDSIMFEYCPEDMTPEQLAYWANYQRTVDPEIDAKIREALTRL